MSPSLINQRFQGIILHDWTRLQDGLFVHPRDSSLESLQIRPAHSVVFRAPSNTDLLLSVRYIYSLRLLSPLSSLSLFICTSQNRRRDIFGKTWAVPNYFCIITGTLFAQMKKGFATVDAPKCLFSAFSFIFYRNSFTFWVHIFTVLPGVRWEDWYMTRMSVG